MKAVEWHPEVIVVRAPTRSEESESEKSSAGSWNIIMITSKNKNQLNDNHLSSNDLYK